MSVFLSPDQLFPGLFERVQGGRLFSDSKTFVDCTPRREANEIVAAYESEKNDPNFDLRTFVGQHFEMPKDHSSGFTFNSERSATEHAIALWPYLRRKGGDKYIPGNSLIPIPYDYIVPGGRFGEMYYWDSYFTMLGLAACGEEELIESMIRNFAFQIDAFGHIPNGNRTYFLSRSQPPFFYAMVQLLAEIKGKDVLDRFLPHVEKEYRYWMFGHRYLPRLGVNRYWDDNPAPRQESYLEDVEWSVLSDRDASDIYRDIRAACESGWDFSSRWLADGCTMQTIETTQIVPVDLNALLYGMESFLLDAYEHQGRRKEWNAIELNRRRRKRFLDSKCWDPSEGMYFDVHFGRNEKTSAVSLATVYPLFCRMSSPAQARAVAENLEKKFLRKGGLVTTTTDTGQQWDAPNGWAPLQWLAVKGLRDYGIGSLSTEIASRWCKLNERVYASSGKFVEKYNVVDVDLEAGGGEYPVQDGFGWSNGVYLAMKDLM